MSYRKLNYHFKTKKMKPKSIKDLICQRAIFYGVSEGEVTKDTPGIENPIRDETIYTIYTDYPKADIDEVCSLFSIDKRAIKKIYLRHLKRLNKQFE